MSLFERMNNLKDRVEEAEAADADLRELEEAIQDCETLFEIAAEDVLAMTGSNTVMFGADESEDICVVIANSRMASALRHAFTAIITAADGQVMYTTDPDDGGEECCAQEGAFPNDGTHYAPGSADEYVQ